MKIINGTVTNVKNTYRLPNSLKSSRFHQY